MNPTSSQPSPAPRRPLQFRLRSMLMLTAACALVFGTLRWLGVSPRSAAVLAVVLSVSSLAAVALLAVIARSLDTPVPPDDADRWPPGDGSR